MLWNMPTNRSEICLGILMTPAKAWMTCIMPHVKTTHLLCIPVMRHNAKFPILMQLCRNGIKNFWVSMWMIPMMIYSLLFFCLRSDEVWKEIYCRNQ